MFAQFRDTWQDGSHLTLYEAKGSIEGANAKAKWQIEGAKRSTKLVWDSILGSQVILLGNRASKARMSLSHPAGLGLRQPCLCVQVLYNDGDLFNIDLHVVDTSGRKHVLYLSSTFRDTSGDHVLHSKIPIHFKASGNWTSICIDLQAITHKLFNTVTSSVDFQTLDSIVLHGNCSVKRVFTLKQCPRDDFEGVTAMPPADIEQIPPSLQLLCRNGSRAQTQVINLHTCPAAYADGSANYAHQSNKEADKPVIAFGSRITKLSKSPPKSALKLSTTRNPQASEVADTCAADRGSQCDDNRTTETTPHTTATGRTMHVSRHTNSDVVLLNGIQAARPAVLKTDGEIWAAVASAPSNRPKAFSKRSQGLHFPRTLANREQPASEESEEDDSLFISGTSLSQQERVKSVSRTAAQADRDKPPFPEDKMKPRRGDLEVDKQRPSAATSLGQNSSSERLPCYDGGDSSERLPCYDGGDLPIPSSDEDNAEQHSNAKQFAFQFRGGPSVLNSRITPVQQNSQTPPLTHAKSDTREAGRSTARKWAFTDASHMSTTPMTPLHQPLELSLGVVDVPEQRRERDTSAVSSTAQSTSVDTNIADISKDTLQKANMPENITADSPPRLAACGLIGEDGSYLLPSFVGRGSCSSRMESRLSERSSLSSMSWMMASKTTARYENLSDGDLESFNQLKLETEEGRDESVIVHAVNTEPADFSRASSHDLPSPHSTMGSSLDYPLDILIGKDLGDSFGDDDRLHFGSQLEEAHAPERSRGLWDEDASVSHYIPGDSTNTSPVFGAATNEEMDGMPMEETDLRSPLLDNHDLDYDPHIPSPSLSTGPPDATYTINSLLPALNATAPVTPTTTPTPTVTTTPTVTGIQRREDYQSTQ